MIKNGTDTGSVETEKSENELKLKNYKELEGSVIYATQFYMTLAMLNNIYTF